MARTEDSALRIQRCDAADGTTQLVLSGELDLTGAEFLADALEGAERGGAVVVVDLRGLEFMDSSGLHALLLAHARMEEAGGRLVLVQGPRAVRRVFEVTNTEKRFELLSRPEAMYDRPGDGGSRHLIAT